MGRQDRQFWGEAYARGLLLEGERKSVEPMAARLPEGNVQAMQQMVGQSPWPHEPLRRELARRMTGMLSRPVTWIVDDTGFPKQGRHSVGVARQYWGTLGKVGNCQVAASLHYATDDACVPLDMELYLPKEWTDDRDRCLAAGVPPERIAPLEKWRIALERIDQARAWGIRQGTVAADADYGRVQAFRHGLHERRLSFVVGIHRDQVVTPCEVPAPSRSRRTPQAASHPPLAVQVLAPSLPPGAWQRIVWREGSRGPMTGRFAAVRVQDVVGGNEAVPGWLLIEWPEAEPAPTGYWLSNLPPETPLAELVYLAKIRWMVQQNYQQMKEELGLDHYEGRGYRGWHHHLTLTFLAYAFLLYLHLRSKKTSGWTIPGVLREIQQALATWGGFCMVCGYPVPRRQESFAPT